LTLWIFGRIKRIIPPPSFCFDRSRQSAAELPPIENGPFLLLSLQISVCVQTFFSVASIPEIPYKVFFAQEALFLFFFPLQIPLSLLL
jgi:hypothetical protein